MKFLLIVAALAFASVASATPPAHFDKPAIHCNDGDVCTGAEAPASFVFLQISAEPIDLQGNTCDDGKACTSADLCVASESGGILNSTAGYGGADGVNTCTESTAKTYATLQNTQKNRTFSKRINSPKIAKYDAAHISNGQREHNDGDDVLLIVVLRC